MKKLLSLLVLAVAASSCAVQYQEKRYILDYRPFLEQGFRLSPAPTLNEPHDCLASIWLEVIPGKTTQTVRTSDGLGGMVEREIPSKKRKGNSVDEVLETFVNYAKELGATGAINVKSDVRTAGGITIYELSGVAVRINK